MAEAPNAATPTIALVCSPVTRPDVAIAPTRATPTALPVWRAALKTADAAPPRLAGAASMIAMVVAGMAKPMPKPVSMMRARLCYDHLAGRLGVALLAALVDRGVLGHAGGGYEITEAGFGELAAFGVDAAGFSRRRPAVSYCVDWEEQRHHLAGALGEAVTGRLFALDWLRRGRSRRVVTLSEAGETGLHEVFGLPRDWAG
jgi:hypothetical protein